MLNSRHVLMAAFLVIAYVCSHFGTKWASDIYVDGQRCSTKHNLFGYALMGVMIVFCGLFVWMLDRAASHKF